MIPQIHDTRELACPACQKRHLFLTAPATRLMAFGAEYQKGAWEPQDVAPVSHEEEIELEKGVIQCSTPHCPMGLPAKTLPGDGRGAQAALDRAWRAKRG